MACDVRQPNACAPAVRPLTTCACAPQFSQFLDSLCLENIDSNFFGILVEASLLFYCFLAVATVADAHLVVSLETLCVRWNVREDVAGASFMAFGSAAPEIIINAIQTIKSMGGGDAGSDDTDLGIGGIIGSGMIAFTVIPGVCGLCAKEVLSLKRRPLARDVGFYSLALIILCRGFADGVIELSEAGPMVLLYILYLLVVVCSSGVRQMYRINYLGRAPRAKTSFVTQAAEATPAAEAVVQPLSMGNLAAAPPDGGGEVLTVVATPLGEEQQQGAASGGGVWDAQPVHVSPMEFSHTEIGASLTGGARAQAVAHPPSPLAQARGACESVVGVCVRPLNFVLSYTCPECAHDGPGARWYPVTFASSFAWVAVLSTIISAIVGRWGELMGVPPSFLGMYVIAIGAEIPDTIQSVTVAKRGYGSMAVSNSTGSQIINILIGLGMPWLMSNLAGRPIAVQSVPSLRVMASFQAVNVAIYMSLLLLPTIRTWRPGDHSKASLGKRKGKVLMGTYVVALVVCAPILLLTE